MRILMSKKEEGSYMSKKQITLLTTTNEGISIYNRKKVIWRNEVNAISEKTLISALQVLSPTGDFCIIEVNVEEELYSSCIQTKILIS